MATTTNDAVPHSYGAIAATQQSFPTAAAANFNAMTAAANSGSQFPFTAPNVVMMTNAVAAAVQQMSQQASSQGAHSAGFPPVVHNMLTSRTPDTAAAGQLHPHMAALLGAAGFQCSMPAFSMRSQISSNTSSVPPQPQLHQTLSTAMPTAVAATSMPAGSMTNVLLPSMQTWSVQQIGENYTSTRIVLAIEYRKMH
jgi:hypothetical protein